MYAKDSARDIFHHALQSVLPENFMAGYCRLDDEFLRVSDKKYNLQKYKNIYVFGSGKAAYTMAKEMEKILGDRVYKGLIVSPYDNKELKNIKVRIGSHPVPDQKSLDAAKALLDRMQECGEDDLYIYLLSGGSSALIEIPIPPVDLEDLQKSTNLMLSHNLDILEINTLRKHISQIKGGRLATECKAEGIVLVISDIVDNDLYSIGSAPLYADKSSFADAKNILDMKDLYFHMPDSVTEVLQKGLQGEIKESPKEPLERVEHRIIASNSHALQAAKEYALSLGLSVKIAQEMMQGEVEEMVKKMLEIAKSSKERCILFGGECTVELAGEGQGGRNQHAALLMLKEISQKNLNMTFLSAGTDGIDGNSDAAGGVVDKASCIRAKELNLNLDRYLQNFDSHSFLKQIDDLIITGASGTNVIDIAILIKGDDDG
ncbi:DUF4147 domain-containing protein [bacterium]|nr:DUF4147 domain-containing protein [bacterium]MBU1989509.1 DUF4147 domain-containing protein [bacterium]